ncbi:MAG TPA: glycosyltransferase [Anaerolineales bacterium]|nr:glycosyltransferase [Anaerolineales bacterium]
MNSDSSIAFVVDPLVPLGGAEKVLFAALEAFPHASIFTLVYNKPIFTNTPLANREIRTSGLNSFPLVQQYHRYLLPLMPAAIERLDLRPYDTIVSFNYAVANGAKNYNGARHISYTHTPMRYAWTDLNINGTHSNKNRLIDAYLSRFRAWDRKAASRVHAIATNSRAVSQRIRRAYGREARIIHPPVEVDRFQPNPKRDDYFITVMRLMPYKRVDLLVRTFNELNLPLVIVGDGPEFPRLKRMANSNIKLLGYQPDETVAELLGKARAFVCAAEEDFGIAIVEAQAAGCPVIAYGSGGALETVEDGVTGLLFPEQSASCIMDAVERFARGETSFETDTMVKNARRFSKDRFLDEFAQFVKLIPTNQ